MDNRTINPEFSFEAQIASLVYFILDTLCKGPVPSKSPGKIKKSEDNY